jgi:hypothetical protein
MPELGFTLNSDATAASHDDGIVILDVRTGCLYSSNRIGSCIWRGIERQMALEEIANEISDAYQIARSTAKEHTVRFVGELERHALIARQVAS